MFTFSRILRLAIAASLLLNIASIGFGGATCYACNPITLSYLVVLHGILMAGTFANSKPIKILVLTFVVFYANRVAVIELGPQFYNYPSWMPTSDEMAYVMFALCAIVACLFLGCHMGEVFIHRRRNEEIFVVPLARNVDEKKHYFVLVWILIAAEIVHLYLLLTTGVGLPIGKQFFDVNLLRLAKAVDVLVFSFALVPAAWWIIKKPTGIERKITVLSLVLFVLVELTSLSKVSLVYSIMPFAFAYYVTGMKIPAKLTRRMAVSLVVVAIFLSNALSVMRTSIADSFLTGDDLKINVTSVDVGANVFTFMSRVGSSFDVFALVTHHADQFSPFLNFPAEIIDSVNGFIPGDLIVLNPPRWSQLLFAIGHDADYENMLRYQTGENITLPGHLYVNFGLLMACVVSFSAMFVYGYAYTHAGSVVIRVFLLWSILMDVSNGSGIVGMFFGFLMQYAYFGGALLSYRLVFAPLMGTGRRTRPIPAALPRNTFHRLP